MKILMVLLVLMGMAWGHDRYGNADFWINNGIYRSPIDGTHCCGERDCVEVPNVFVREVAEGFLVTGRLQYPGAEVDVNEIIPYRHALVSKDGQYWRCKKGDGSVRCFFAPPGTT